MSDDGSTLITDLRRLAEELGRRPVKTRLLLWESADPRVAEAAHRLHRAAIATPVLLADPEIGEAPAIAGADRLSSRRVIEEWGSRGRGRPPQRRSEVAGAALALGLVDAAVGGVMTASAEVIRAGLDFVGLADGTRTVSIGGLVEPVAGPLAGRLFLMTDTGAVREPLAARLVEIAANALRTWRCIHSERPRVAFLSASSGGSMAFTQRIALIREAVRWLREREPECDVDGEMQLDAAVSPPVAAAKGLGGPPAGLPLTACAAGQRAAGTAIEQR